MLERLWRGAPHDAEVRADLVRELERRDDPRVATLRVTLEPARPETWVAALRALPDAEPEACAWFLPFTTHWPDAARGPHTLDAINAIMSGGSTPLAPLYRTLRVFGTSSFDPAALAPSPALKHIRHLTVSNARLDDAGLEALLASPRLGALEHLDLSYNAVGARGVTAIAGTSLPALRVLELSGNQGFDEDAAETLGASTAKLPRLEHLDLSHQPLHGALRHFAETCTHASLRTLRIHGCGGRASDAEALAALSQIDVLHASRNSFGDSGAAAFSALTGLRDLSLHEDRTITDAGLIALSALERLERLQLNATRVTDAGAEHLAAHGMPRLSELRLTRIGLTADGIRALLTTPHLPALSRLAVERIALSVEEVQMLADAPWDHPLEELFITLSSAAQEVVAAAATFPASTRLRCLEKLSATGLKRVARAAGLRGYSKLRRAELRDALAEHLGISPAQP